MFQHMHNWLDFYETRLLGRNLEADDYIFPTLNASGILFHPRPVSAEIVQKKINEAAYAAGLTGAGHFTTHCF